jgi:hypothetical protein
MTLALTLRQRVSEPTFSFGLVLNGVAQESETPSVTYEIYWRWDDEPEMKPEYLGQGVAGHSLRVPFETKGRNLRLFLVSRTGDGLRSVARIEEAVQTVFSAPALAYSGEQNIEAAEDLSPFDLIHIFEDGGTPKAELADSTDNTKPARAFVVEAAFGGSLHGGDLVRLFFGGNIITKTGAGWTPGSVLYLGTSGGITDTEPTTSGSVSQVIGTAITSETAIFEPDEPFENP